MPITLWDLGLALLSLASARISCSLALMMLLVGVLVRSKQSSGKVLVRTTIDDRGPGALFEFRNKTFGTTGTKPAGGAHGLTILGWNNGNSNTYGIRYGDIWRMRITDVVRNMGL
jgi:hypothetical protein